MLLCCYEMLNPYLFTNSEQFGALQVLAFIYQQLILAKITLYHQKPSVFFRFYKQIHELRQELRYASSSKHLFKHVGDYWGSTSALLT